MVGSRTSGGETDYLSLIRKAVEYHLQNDSSKPFGIAVNPFTDIHQPVESLL
ncbi:hypothetical protein [Clostridium sp. AF02-29]|uniref:hypothetical protein n=1 Tax=Clostridium sp. AF02-29 TaxID=2292993 RepID=UPI001FAAAA0E|nr:hypothetical protein [Clostridium sp. AF02-29]